MSGGQVETATHHDRERLGCASLGRALVAQLVLLGDGAVALVTHRARPHHHGFRLGPEVMESRGPPPWRSLGSPVDRGLAVHARDHVEHEVGPLRRAARPAGGRTRAPPARSPCARGRSAARPQPTSVAAQHAVTRELETPVRAPSAAGAEDPAVRRLLGDERVLHAVARAALVDPNAARDDLNEAALRAPPICVRAEARTGHSCARTSAGGTRSGGRPCSATPSPQGRLSPQTARLLKTTRSGSAGSNWVIALCTMPKLGRARNTPPTSSAVAHSS